MEISTVFKGHWQSRCATPPGLCSATVEESMTLVVTGVAFVSSCFVAWRLGTAGTSWTDAPRTEGRHDANFVVTVGTGGCATSDDRLGIMTTLGIGNVVTLAVNVWSNNFHVCWWTATTCMPVKFHRISRRSRKEWRFFSHKLLFNFQISELTTLQSFVCQLFLKRYIFWQKLLMFLWDN